MHISEAVTWKRCQIRPNLFLMMDRKSYVGLWPWKVNTRSHIFSVGCVSNNIKDRQMVTINHGSEVTYEVRGGSRNSLRGGGVLGQNYSKGGGLGSRSVGIFIYWHAKKNKKTLKGGFKPPKPPPPLDPLLEVSFGIILFVLGWP